jgi:hypothetical protein
VQALVAILGLASLVALLEIEISYIATQGANASTPTVAGIFTAKHSDTNFLFMHERKKNFHNEYHFFVREKLLLLS